MVSHRYKKGVAATCPACDTPIYFRKRLGSGQVVVCRECDSLLRVFSVSPLRLAWAFQDPLDNLFPLRSGSKPKQEWWEYDDYEDVDTFSSDDAEYLGDTNRRYE